MSDSGPFGSSVDVPVSDLVILIVSLIGFGILAGTVYSIVLMRLQTASELEKSELDYTDQLQHANVATLTRAQRRARANLIMKQQRRIAPVLGEDADALEEELAQQSETLHFLSRKERQKAAKEAERLERLKYQQERQEQQKEAIEIARIQKRERQAEQAILLQQKQAAQKVLKEQQQRAAHEQWKTFIASDKERMTVEEFRLEYCQKLKSVPLLPLSERFRVPLHQLKARIQELVTQRRLTGIVMQDNTFLHLTDQELDTVASFLIKKQSGSFDQMGPELEKMIATS